MRIDLSKLVKYCMALTLLPLAAMSSQQTTSARPDDLRRYIDCGLGDRFSVEESRELAQPFVRSVSTPEGPKDVVVLHGFNLHVAYVGTPFVNLMAERLGDFDSAKSALLHNLTLMAVGTPDMVSKTPSRFSLDGFDVHTTDRTKLSGGVQSVYLLFSDADQTVVTLYILNTPPEAPQFSTIEQYRALRDEFVRTYTACVARNLKEDRAR